MNAAFEQAFVVDACGRIHNASFSYTSFGGDCRIRKNLAAFADRRSSRKKSRGMDGCRNRDSGLAKKRMDRDPVSSIRAANRGETFVFVPGMLLTPAFESRAPAMDRNAIGKRRDDLRIVIENRDDTPAKPLEQLVQHDGLPRRSPENNQGTVLSQCCSVTADERRV